MAWLFDGGTLTDQQHRFVVCFFDLSVRRGLRDEQHLVWIPVGGDDLRDAIFAERGTVSHRG